MPGKNDLLFFLTTRNIFKLKKLLLNYKTLLIIITIFQLFHITNSVSYAKFTSVRSVGYSLNTYHSIIYAPGFITTVTDANNDLIVIYSFYNLYDNAGTGETFSVYCLNIS